MDALMLLTGDHNRVRGLFKKWREAEDNDNMTEAAALAEKIVHELQYPYDDRGGDLLPRDPRRVRGDPRDRR